MERTETFVFKFTNKKVFEDFFTKYYASSNEGMKVLSCGIGDYIKKEDELLGLIDDLYNMAANNYVAESKKEEILEKAEKLLGI